MRCHLLKALHGRTTYIRDWCECTDCSTSITRELACELTCELTWCWKSNVWFTTSSNRVQWYVEVVCSKTCTQSCPKYFKLSRSLLLSAYLRVWAKRHPYSRYITGFNEAPTFSVMDGCGTRLKQKTSHLVTLLSWNFRSLMRNRNQHNHPRRPGGFKVYSVWRYMP